MHAKVHHSIRLVVLLQPLVEGRILGVWRQVPTPTTSVVRWCRLLVAVNMLHIMPQQQTGAQSLDASSVRLTNQQRSVYTAYMANQIYGRHAYTANCCLSYAALHRMDVLQC